MGFDAVRFNDEKIIFNTNGGPVFNTQIVTTNGGREQRNAIWEYPRGKWQFNDRLVLEDEKDYILSFFYARQGRENGFLFKDWSDFEAKNAGVINKGAGNHTGVGQLYKKYASGPSASFRKIVKPVAGTVEVFMDGQPLNATVDHATGAVAIDPVIKPITAAVANGSGTFLVDVAAHGFQSGDLVFVDLGAGPWSALSGLKVATINGPNAIQFPGAANGLPAFSPSGATKLTWYPQARNALTWTGEFDVPVRFDEDSLSLEFHAAEVVGYGVLGEKGYNFSGVTLVELKY